MFEMDVFFWHGNRAVIPHTAVQFFLKSSVVVLDDSVFFLIKIWQPWHLHITAEDDWPVECVEHFDSDQHRQGHGRGVTGFKHLTVYVLEHGVLLSTLHEVSL